MRSNYSEDEIQRSYDKWNDLTQEEFDAIKTIEAELLSRLKEVSLSDDLVSKEAAEVFEKHKEWLKLVSPTYSKEYHLYLAELYMMDERFAEYYHTKAGDNAAYTLTEIIKKHA